MKTVFGKTVFFSFNALLSAYLAVLAMLLTIPTGALIVEEKSLSLFGFVFFVFCGDRRSLRRVWRRGARAAQKGVEKIGRGFLGRFRPLLDRRG